MFYILFIQTISNTGGYGQNSVMTRRVQAGTICQQDFVFMFDNEASYQDRLAMESLLSKNDREILYFLCCV